MTQLELDFNFSTDKISYSTARLIELWCAEPVFFASRELSDTYYTESAIGNYALAYALGWARSPYRLTGQDTGRPRYIEDLTPLSGHSYILPAWPANGTVSLRFERFNALSDSYWYAMTNNRVATAREDVPLSRSGKKPSTYRPSNFPQTGRLRMIERGNRFQTLVFGDRELPEYIRVGKFTSKVRVEIIKKFDVVQLPRGDYRCNTYLSAADLPANIELLAFDLISMPPASLLKNLSFRGEALQAGDFILPANLEFCGSNHNG
ncbi:MAG: type I-D CRISPR-associated protein Cas5/Csc1 [Microcoleus sp. PH2017_10_PVI_O_A]|uniref:type I-D CRISPR-associated protein Cas5/Csc1 n=1 Tax=unclassified Microcoleus TaxID=2642155 RepID=UPI001E094F3E|nr:MULTISPECIES: type I-D CRISPR-associated protein Cas5/Csc1 [unclassified Microcoleus]TAE79727.1 MAG: type I-D CRISPR-associated protein Cas5/Csc1 [Oscillatoriales cyanobacterium]MCC3407542.1 type I-D CRISPR-associated protein Cas5/Csc1 [Microcoleus sp. PH2017_10_PVI_O_A]MCC3460171.1 type I-D CRISPR-associated protein Cas5/Csc1 [Microcoleus sp. PH2017_11_PCY_U_A]MCC3480099.1 type I-D CRISPR-associated protein Cas5/Csc1 [Microcoleus sp. PH2017_12_PCY_D_A]MCC3559479.1 type I-D CRISPR-associate